MRLKWFYVLGIALTWAAFAVGCATVRMEKQPVLETTLMVTRAGDETTLSWASDAGLTYVILFAEARDSKARWQVLPGAERVRGTGATVVWHDRVPSGTTRYYRLQGLPARAP